jgi:hypothetical protein
MDCERIGGSFSFMIIIDALASSRKAVGNDCDGNANCCCCRFLRRAISEKHSTGGYNTANEGSYDRKRPQNDHWDLSSVVFAARFFSRWRFSCASTFQEIRF